VSAPVDVAFGSAAAHRWRTRVEGTCPVPLRHTARWAEPEPRGVRLGLQVDRTSGLDPAAFSP